MRAELERRLQDLGCLPCGSASLADEPIARAEQSGADVVLLDVPRHDSVPSAETAREVRSRLGLPLVLLAEGEAAESLGAEGYVCLGKPQGEGELESALLVARCRHLMRQELEETRRSEESFRLLVDSVTEYAIFMLDAAGNVTSWNPGAERLKGYTADEIIGRHFSSFFTAEQLKAGVPEYQLKTAAMTGRFEETGWCHRKDGSRFYAHIVFTAMRDANGELRGYSEIAHDLTNQQRVEDDLRQAIRIRDEFLSIASHELRTPLTALELQVQTLCRTVAQHDGTVVPADEILRRAQFVARQADRLKSLVESLLDVSRAVAGRLSIFPQRVDLIRVVRDVVERFREQMAKGQCVIGFDAQGPCEGHWDPMRVEQILTNLLSNACKYGAAKPVEVRLTVEQGNAVLSVRDHGIGVRPEDRERIFERFERAVSHRHYGGLGLGLWIVKQIVTAMDGHIAVSSDAGQGSEFVVTLPSATAHTDEPAVSVAMQGVIPTLEPRVSEASNRVLG